MDTNLLIRRSECRWEIPRSGRMAVPVIVCADEALVRAMDDKVREQAVNVASLPGIVQACYVMPDAHWGYGFPIGGVAAFDAEHGGVVSAGGVGFDVSCGVRCLHTGLTRADVLPVQRQLARLSAVLAAEEVERQPLDAILSIHGAPHLHATRRINLGNSGCAVLRWIKNALAASIHH